MAGPRGRWLRRIGVLAILSMGCDGGPPLSDAGSQPDAASGDAGGGPVDEIAPRVTSTRPRNGEDLVARTAELEIRFSEAIRSDSGVVSATSAGLAIALGEGVWVPEGDVLRIAAEELWPGGARVDVRVQGFEDLAGNAQAVAHELVFHTSDEGPPTRGGEHAGRGRDGRPGRARAAHHPLQRADERGARWALARGRRG